MQGTSGNLQYKGTAPIFVTTKLADLESLEWAAQINPANGLPWDADASMVTRRLKVYKFTERMPKPKQNFRFCGHCFSRLLAQHAPAK